MTEAEADAAEYIENLPFADVVELITPEYFDSNQRVFTVIDYYQGVVYDAYTNTDYSVNKAKLASLMGFGWNDETEEPEGLNLRRAYRLIAAHLQKHFFPCTLPARRPQPAALYDDIFEVALLRSRGLLTNRALTTLKNKPATGPFAVDSDAMMEIGDAIHDGWALKTIADQDKLANGEIIIMSEDKLAATIRKRKHQLKPFEDLDRISQLQDWASYCAIVFALNVCENEDEDKDSPYRALASPYRALAPFAPPKYGGRARPRPRPRRSSPRRPSPTPTTKVHVLGRLRLVHKVPGSRAAHVTVQGKLIPLASARRLEKRPSR
jgi:hypothetical protein